MTIAGATVSNPHRPAAGVRGGDLPERNPNRVPYPFGPKQLAWLERFIPIAQYGAKRVQDSDAMAARARELANG